MTLFGGMKIVPHALALQRGYEVKPHPIRKRRRNWQVVRYVRPGCWQIGDTFYMHPEVLDNLRATIEAKQSPQGGNDANR